MELRSTKNQKLLNIHIKPQSNNLIPTNGGIHFKPQLNYQAPTNGERQFEPQLGNPTSTNVERHFKPPHLEADNLVEALNKSTQ